MATGTRVNYREAAELARDPYVEDLTEKVWLNYVRNCKPIVRVLGCF